MHANRKTGVTNQQHTNINLYNGLIITLRLTRYHCNEEMDFIGQNREGYWFECKFCQAREMTLDINKPTTPDEIARPSMLEYRLGGNIPKEIYNRTK